MTGKRYITMRVKLRKVASGGKKAKRPKEKAI